LDHALCWIIHLQFCSCLYKEKIPQCKKDKKRQKKKKRDFSGHLGTLDKKETGLEQEKEREKQRFTRKFFPGSKKRRMDQRLRYGSRPDFEENALCTIQGFLPRIFDPCRVKSSSS